MTVCVCVGVCERERERERERESVDVCVCVENDHRESAKPLLDYVGNTNHIGVCSLYFLRALKLLNSSTPQ